MYRNRKWLPLAGLVPLPSEGEGGADGGNPPAGDPPPSDPPKPDEGKTFTQADVDEMIRKRLSREKLDDLKKKAAEWDKHQAASATDEQKREAEIEKAKQDALVEATKAAAVRIATADVRAAAVTAGFIDPADALARLRDQLDGVVGDDGEVDSKAVDKLVADLAKAAPHLLKTPSTPSPSAAGIGTGAASGGSNGGSIFGPQAGQQRLAAAYGAASPTK